MNPLQQLITLFATLIGDLRAKANAAIAGLPPLESIEASNTVLSALRDLTWVHERIVREMDNADSVMANAARIVEGFAPQAGESASVAACRLMDVMMAVAGDQALSAALDAGTHLTADQRDTAVNAAREEARDAARTDFDTQVNNLRILAERRAELTTSHGAVAAASLPESLILAESYQDHVTALQDRLAAMAAAGMTEEAHPRNFAALLACSYDETGVASFTAGMESFSEVRATLVPVAATTTPPAQDPPPAAATTTPAAGSGEKRKPVI